MHFQLPYSMYAAWWHHTDETSELECSSIRWLMAGSTRTWLHAAVAHSTTGRKTSSFRTVRILKICRTSGLDVMSGRALVEWLWQKVWFKYDFKNNLAPLCIISFHVKLLWYGVSNQGLDYSFHAFFFLPLKNLFQGTEFAWFFEPLKAYSKVIRTELVYKNWFISAKVTVQVNIFQKHLVLHELTHNMTKYCSLSCKLIGWKFQAQYMLI